MLKMVSFIPRHRKFLCFLNSYNFNTFHTSCQSYMSVDQNKSSTKTTVDENEIKHFNNQANIWWDEMGQVKALHSMNMVRVPFIRDALINANKIKIETADSPKPLIGLDILDVGCGGGILTESVARLGANVTGLDASSDLIEIAKFHASKDQEIANNINYQYDTIENFSKNNQLKYDAVIASEIIEHVNQQELFLKACVETLKPGGSIFVSTMNKTYICWVGAIIAAEYIFKFIPKGTHDWNKFISPEKVQKMLQHNDCSTKVVHGMFYNLTNNKWFWISSTSGCYALHAVKKA